MKMQQYYVFKPSRAEVAPAQRYCHFLFAILALTSEWTACGAQENVAAKNGDVKVMLTIPDGEYFAGDVINCELKIDNNTDEAIVIFVSPPEDKYRLSCFRDKKQCQLTTFGKDLYNVNGRHPSTGVKGAGIEPHSTRIRKIEVSRIFDLSQEGTYLIKQQISLFANKESGRVQIGPNEVSLEISLLERGNE